MRDMPACVWLTLLLTTVSGCGSSDGSSGNGVYSSGVDSSKQISSLTDVEIQEICQSSTDYVTGLVNGGQFKDSSCTAAADVVGLFAASTGTADQATMLCQSTYDACVQDFMATVSPPTSCVKPANCTITVGQLEQCANDRVATYGSNTLPSCANADFTTLTMADITAAIPTSTGPASCTQAEQNCAGVTTLVSPNVANSGAPGTTATGGTTGN